MPSNDRKNRQHWRSKRPTRSEIRPSNICWHPIVAVPARNEEERLPKLIAALGRQSWLRGRNSRLAVVIVLNNCTDGSRESAMQAAAAFPQISLDLIEVTFPPAEAHVGSARRLAMEAAWLARPHSHSVLMTTDADAIPARTWIDANLEAIEEGADIVGGLIVGDREEENLLGLQFRRRAARHLRYAKLADYLASLIDPLPYDPWPRHANHTGASIAVRADVYAAVGGCPAVSSREDLSFVDRVISRGYRLRHSLEVRVCVSARLEGRALGGMADCLKAWVTAAGNDLPHFVEEPEAIRARLRERRRLRLALQEPAWIDEIAQRCPVSIPPAWVIGQRVNPAGLIQTLAPDISDALAAVPIEIASDRITRMILDAKRQRRNSA